MDLNRQLLADFEADVAAASQALTASARVLSRAAALHHTRPTEKTALDHGLAMHGFRGAVLALHGVVARWAPFGFSLDSLDPTPTPGRRYIDELLAWATKYGDVASDEAIGELWRIFEKTSRAA